MKKLISLLYVFILMGGIFSTSMGHVFYAGSQSQLQTAIYQARDNYYYENNTIYVYRDISITYDEVLIHNVNENYNVSLTIMTYPGYSTKTIYCNNVNPNGFCLEDSKRIYIKELEFVMNDNRYNKRCIRLKNCYDIDIKECEFYDNYPSRGNTAIILDYHAGAYIGNKYIEIRNNHIEEFSRGIWVASAINGWLGQNEYTDNSIETRDYGIYWEQLGGYNNPRFWNNWVYCPQKSVRAKNNVTFSSNMNHYYPWDTDNGIVLTSEGSSCEIQHGNSNYEWCYDRLRSVNSGSFLYFSPDSWRQCPDIQDP